MWQKGNWPEVRLVDFSDVTVVLPPLDPDQTLVGVVEGLLREGFRDVILVNDCGGYF